MVGSLVLWGGHLQSRGSKHSYQNHNLVDIADIFFLFFSVWGWGNGRRRPSRQPAGSAYIENRGRGGGANPTRRRGGRGYRPLEDVCSEGGGKYLFCGAEIPTKPTFPLPPKMI